MRPLIDRVDEAIRRVTSGAGAMRIPAEDTDPDLVLVECRRRILDLEAEVRRHEEQHRRTRAAVAEFEAGVREALALALTRLG